MTTHFVVRRSCHSQLIAGCSLKNAMRANVRYRFAWLGSIVFLALVTMPMASAKSPKYIHAKVRFLATSTSTHSSSGENHDVYLIEITAPGESNPELARLEDVYPHYRDALSGAVLKSPDGAKLKIIRDRSCDVAFGSMPLRTAPGDPTAILPERLGYRPSLAELPNTDEVLPCFKTVR